ncbi:hypothetical protein L873DRAFT_1849406 [Choiromyces venosus 120613-1]|uniref:BTB domain-containing protein n=1 Tax=Choiromyces venosus 120613-1 TaxID=1336337 RepID=A0A3N4ITV7_9PEZI|nr:hypothetical protein L873DRAFT_1849406 [Choiromyces venosus 120613-1]
MALAIIPRQHFSKTYSTIVKAFSSYLDLTMAQSTALQTWLKYKEFIFAGTVTLYVGPHSKKMEIHKKLLAGISSELSKLANIDTKEGIEGVIHLPEEGEDLINLFIEWAYTGEYEKEDESFIAVKDPTQLPKQRDIWSVLRMHIELYIFSDKFNIPTLMKLAKAKFCGKISSITIEYDSHVLGLISILEYAYDKLSDSDPICLYLARYSASKLKSLRSRDEFIKFASNQPGFMKEFLANLPSSSGRVFLR